VNFLGRWIGRGVSLVWPRRSPDITPLGLSESQSQRVNTLDKLKARDTAAIANVRKDMLQRVWKELDCRWDVCIATDFAHYEVFHT
jgi:hypothetical protein